MEKYGKTAVFPGGYGRIGDIPHGLGSIGLKIGIFNRFFLIGLFHLFMDQNS